MHTVLEVLQDTGGQSGEVTLKLQLQISHEGGIHGEMDSLESHDRGGPNGRDIPPDGEELAGPVLVGGPPYPKEGVQDRNKAVFVYGK